MVDALGRRLKLGVIATSANPVVQPEFDATRPALLNRIDIAGPIQPIRVDLR